ncbi:MAG: glycosyltransferase [Flavobacteriaceae bacterium]|nr:glycosyltransferase [Flavobacteriaceae bacterium]
MSTSTKIRILFLLPSLSAGGAERVMSFVSQNINKHKFHPVLLIAGFKKDTVYDVSNIEVVYLNKSRILTALPAIIFFFRKFKPQIVISSIAHVNTAMGKLSPLFPKTKFVGREATVLSQRKNETKSRKRSIAYVISNGFEKLDAIVCQSKDMAEDMVTNYGVSRKKIKVINNPISNLPPAKTKSLNGIPKRFITVGRLTEIKGHIRLLRILSKLKRPFSYTIIGNGNLKEAIFKKADELGIKENITHIPYTNKVNKYISENDLFLQGSFVEGFPNALLESCVVGTPVVAFNAPGGTKEIVETEINGFIVNTEEEYLNILNTELKFDSNSVRTSVLKKFNQEIILKQYEDLFQNIITAS